MEKYLVARGLDLPIEGGASGDIVDLPIPSSVAYSPQEFTGMTPKPAVKAGESVKMGSVLFFDKKNPDIVFRSPAAGVVREIRRGDRRVITDIIVDVTGDESEDLASFSLEAIQKMDREAAKAAMMASGSWGALSTRPLNLVPTPDVIPQAILVSATETGPLQPGADVLLSASDRDDLQAGVLLLSKLTDGPVHFTSLSDNGAFDGLEGVKTHRFSGPHPAGDAAVQVNYVEPPIGMNQVWTIAAWDVVHLGRTLRSGRFSNQRVYASVGTAVKNPRFVNTLLGAPISHIVGETDGEELRVIRGSVLTGDAVDIERHASAIKRAIHVIPDTVRQRLLGWALPQPGLWSFHNTFFSGLFGSRKKVSMDVALGGGHRPMIPVAGYEEVVATPDIHPLFLFKSIAAGDLEDAVSLGLLDISNEEAALCTYICPSKVSYLTLLEQGLARYAQEI